MSSSWPGREGWGANRPKCGEICSRESDADAEDQMPTVDFPTVNMHAGAGGQLSNTIPYTPGMTTYSCISLTSISID